MGKLFGKKKDVSANAETDRLKELLGKAQDTILMLEGRLKASDVRVAAAQRERDFWMEQSRQLQNQLQTVMRGQADILEHMASTTLTEEDVIEHLDRMAMELRKPLTSVEAVAAVISMNKPDTQGSYTPRLAGKQDEVELLACQSK